MKPHALTELGLPVSAHVLLCWMLVHCARIKYSENVTFRYNNVFKVFIMFYVFNQKLRKHNPHRSNSSPHPTNIVGRVYPEFFPSFNFL